MHVAEYDIYWELTTLLDKRKANYRVVTHEPEGRTDIASQLHGHKLAIEAKAMVAMIKITKQQLRYCLVVLPGDRKLDFLALQKLYGGTRAMLAPRERAEQLTRCMMGAVPPFTFHRDFDLVADISRQENEEIVISAGRLDTSLFITISSYISIANPRFVAITH